ncbi:uncharacterized protein V6R79_019327 [Siganus canaliculatus]
MSLAPVVSILLEELVELEEVVELVELVEELEELEEVVELVKVEEVEELVELVKVEEVEVAGERRFCSLLGLLTLRPEHGQVDDMETGTEASFYLYLSAQTVLELVEHFCISFCNTIKHKTNSTVCTTELSVPI